MRIFFEKLAKSVTVFTGSTPATVVAFAVIFFWTIGGLFEGFSDSYQMVINTGTTIVTFLMVFLLQRTQNKDSFAIQMKLNELIAAHQGASNRLINIEDLSEEEIAKLHNRYKSLANMLKDDYQKTSPHSVEEIEE